MKSKTLIACLLLFSLIGYLEWGEDSRQFLYEVELEVISKMWTNPTSILHPFVILPLAGQLILLINLIKKKTSKLMTYIGMGGIAVLFLMILFIGIISRNVWIASSAIPFLGTAVITIIYLRKGTTQNH